MDYGNIEATILARISKQRYQHTLGVVEASIVLANRFGADIGKARLAALFHDLARDWSEDKLLNWATEHHFELSEADLILPSLLHGRVAASIAKNDFGVTDVEVLQAISSHTLGNDCMTKLDKILFVADMIEPHRNYPGVERLREIAVEDLDRAILAAFDHTLLYILTQGAYIHPTTLTARNRAWQLINSLPASGKSEE